MNIITLFKENPEFRLAKSIRFAVFVNEQGVAPELEMDAHDANATHVILYHEGQAVGTGRVIFHEDHAAIGRVAVVKSARKKGFGKAICQKLIAIAERKVNKIMLHSQCSAAKFYENLGFTPEGDTFLEADIEHVRMVRYA